MDTDTISKLPWTIHLYPLEVFFFVHFLCSAEVIFMLSVLIQWAKSIWCDFKPVMFIF